MTLEHLCGSGADVTLSGGRKVMPGFIGSAIACGRGNKGFVPSLQRERLQNGARALGRGGDHHPCAHPALILCSVDVRGSGPMGVGLRKPLRQSSTLGTLIGYEILAVFVLEKWLK
jgi:hypothetical protein